ncbi:hypothetical protein L226DRAFT_576336 [Lentinus tigrinus ALCF2SS1-7]|uniref:Uncharacterized protein n=1 Tax=Lentinus tigrinus ALCF2SS1-6 TaxID=1328759 RepID=A0A5C2RXM1_9APHY|nr:hypothetical protein L227DRAFT_615138 [Lentinus tigrinus ALCF2SS1-6]RPD68526.1 hypothetical protein L226DRAFT_576336 [Lentinus tigrinus ALCF2SS1-7]
MSSSASNWPDPTVATQRRVANIALPPHRRTLIDALLRCSSTSARLASSLADIQADEDDTSTYERVLGHLDRALEEAEGMVDRAAEDDVVTEVERHDLPLPTSPVSSPRPSWLAGDDDDDYKDEDEDEDGLGVVDDAQSTGSQRVVISPDPREVFHMHLCEQLLKDLQDPLHAQLQESLKAPLLAELTTSLTTSPTLLDRLATLLCEHIHNKLLDTATSSITPQQTSNTSPSPAVKRERSSTPRASAKKPRAG